MTQENGSKISEAVQLVMDYGFEGMEEAVRILLNEAMRLEREKVLNARPYERTEARQGYANGYKPKQVKSLLGEMRLSVPQVRGEVEFYPTALEKGLRSERALKTAMAEMYIHGVSTRKVRDILEKMCGLEVSSTDVSRATKLLDEELEKWRNRPLGEVPYLQMDARYEKVREGGSVVSGAVLVAVGVLADGRRSILGVSVSLSEAEVHWRNFLQRLKERGIHGIKLITSDDCEGLKKALKTVFGGVPWVRCHVHLQRNAQAYVPRQDMREEVAQSIREILTAPNLDEAERLLAKAVTKYEKKAPKLARWMEGAIPEGFAIFSVPHRLRRKLRSTNLVERLQKEIKRRTAVCTLFPNEGSLLRLVSAILMEQSEEWETGSVYMALGAENDPQS